MHASRVSETRQHYAYTVHAAMQALRGASKPIYCGSLNYASVVRTINHVVIYGIVAADGGFNNPHTSAKQRNRGGQSESVRAEYKIQ